jgi:hypothetical protein
MVLNATKKLSIPQNRPYNKMTMTKPYTMVFIVMLILCIDSLKVQAFVFSPNNLNFDAARISQSHITNAGRLLSFGEKIKNDSNFFIKFTRLNVATKQPPEPPGHGKSVLDIIFLPLVTVALIPATLLLTDMKSIEISIVSRDTTNESFMIGSSIQTADAANNQMDSMGSSITSTIFSGDYDNRYYSELNSTMSPPSIQGITPEVLNDVSNK